jgi:GNAT superfamily N-acetyltransferase
MTTTQRMNFDLSSYRHTFMETSGGGWMSHHQPEGEWLYGLDMGVHPEFRGRGGARLLYRARQQLVRRLGLRGQLTVGMMNGYGAVGGEIGGEEYYREWLEGRREDPTLTRQRKIGFEPLGLIPDYLHDPACGNYGVLLRLDAGCEV